MIYTVEHYTLQMGHSHSLSNKQLSTDIYDLLCSTSTESYYNELMDLALDNSSDDFGGTAINSITNKQISSNIE